MLCDIGCLDCKDSTFFKNSFPYLYLLAFEANPDNYRKILQNTSIPKKDFDVYNLAVSNKSGTSNFHTYLEYDIKRDGLGSLNIRSGIKIVNTYKVKTVRLDYFVLEKYNNFKKIALWIDVEGAESQVLEGIEKIKDKILIIHVELVEDKSIYKTIITRRQIIKFMSEKLGFEEIGHIPHANPVIGDSVFIRKDLLVKKSVNYTIAYSKLKSSLTGTIHKLMPGLAKLRQKMIKY